MINFHAVDDDIRIGISVVVVRITVVVVAAVVAATVLIIIVGGLGSITGTVLVMALVVCVNCETPPARSTTVSAAEEHTPVFVSPVNE